MGRNRERFLATLRNGPMRRFKRLFLPVSPSSAKLGQKDIESEASSGTAIPELERFWNSFGAAQGSFARSSLSARTVWR